MSVNFILNHEEVSYSGDESARLLDTLRDTYGLKSVKCGCKEGECGACAVMIDEKLINSCLVAMGALEGSKVLTLEGFKESEQFKALNKAFSEVSAVQCGFCIPGMTLAAQALLRENPHPTDEEIRTALSGNICRCTGYNAIVTAIKNAAKEGEGLW